MEAFCVKCRKKVQMKSPKAVVLKNSRSATKGVCPTCGTKLTRMGLP